MPATILHNNATFRVYTKLLPGKRATHIVKQVVASKYGMREVPADTTEANEILSRLGEK